jgi:long-chain fatty acid transport protein
MTKKIFGLLMIFSHMAGASFLSATYLKPFDLSARAASLGGAFLAKADDASAMYYNPAGIAFHKGIRIKTSLYFNQLTTTARLSGEEFTHSSNPFQFRGSFFLTWGITDWLGIGVAGFNDYNLETEWVANWPGNRLSIASRLKSFTIRPAVSLRPIKSLSLSLGMDFVSVNTFWSHSLAFPPTSFHTQDDKTVTSDLATKGRGSGLMAGLLFKPLRFVQLGVTFRQKIAIVLEGTNRFHLMDAFEWTLVPAPWGTVRFSTLIQDFYKMQTITGSLTLPEEFSVGLLLRPLNRLELIFDYTQTKWSRFGSWEFTSVNAGGDLNPEFTQQYGDFYGISPDYGNQSVDIGLKDSKTYKMGAELDLSSVLCVRAGYSIHENAVQAETINPAIPDMEHSRLSIGVGYEGALFSLWSNEKISELSVDVYFQYIMAKEQTSSYPGFPYAFDADRWVFGFGVGLNL